MATAGDRDLARARAAKDEAKRLLSDLEEVAGIGLTRNQGGVGLRVNLSRSVTPARQLPEVIGGVPVSYRVVGRVRKQSVADR